MRIKEKSASADALKSIHNNYTTYLGEFQEGTQNYNILKHIIEHGSITPVEAFFDYGCFRLPARIFDIRSKGVPIKSESVEVRSEKGVTKHYAKYSFQEGADDEI